MNIGNYEKIIRSLDDLLKKQFQLLDESCNICRKEIEISSTSEEIDHAIVSAKKRSSIILKCADEERTKIMKLA